MNTWADAELGTADFGDGRLDRRLAVITAAFTRRPSSSIPTACGTWARTQATYRFFSNPSVTPQKILGAHRDACVERLRAEPLVLCVQDTTEINLTSHGATTGLGYLTGRGQRGFAVHSTFPVSAAGVPLGILGQYCWSRPDGELGKHKHRHERPLSEKESQRWLDALEATEAAVPSDVRMITITDREGDMYALFAHPRRTGHDLLIRIVHNRALVNGDHVIDAIENAPSIGSHAVDVRPRPDRAARTAHLTIRMSAVTLCPPRVPSPGSRYEPITVTIILANEEGIAASQSPIRWMLLTTLPVQTLADAIQCLTWYSYRWMIERYHYTLKSGCKMEDLQLETAESLQRALAVYSIVAWRLLWITHHARRAPDASCEHVFLPHEWKALHCAVHDTTTLPSTVPTIREALRWLAQIGGFLGRKGDGDPGVKVLWRGLQQLELGARIYQRLHEEFESNSTCV